MTNQNILAAVAEFNSPVYVYDAKKIENQYHRLQNSFKTVKHLNIQLLLKEDMHKVPRQSWYNKGEYYDSYVKFFMFGDTRGRIQDHIKIDNKVGYAYGTLTDTTLITDKKANIRFLISATITVNENGILKDDLYEYEAIGLPFLAQLGRELYSYELGGNKFSKIK